VIAVAGESFVVAAAIASNGRLFRKRENLKKAND
jgi:hypothetical protein